MSYLKIQNFIKDGKKSLSEGNYLSALSVALALPSMCSRLQYKDEKYKAESKNELDTDNTKYYRIKDNGKLQWIDNKCYIDFCNEFMTVNFGQYVQK